MDRGEKSLEAEVLCSKKQMREALKGPLRSYHDFSNKTIDNMTFRGLSHWISVAQKKAKSELPPYK